MSIGQDMVPGYKAAGARSMDETTMIGCATVLEQELLGP